ncbi:HNH endonuclease [Aristophania vespae]|uniref:HNH endonuclease n=1 Tax=Aristophania vespae TaxID=2697033 RepID=UPI002351833D|nr:HNH endonuclease signature motif containing protein [Aristophania vespae]UMM63108.1 hypothetical protein DM15PD_00620 [Aristophania vespae]
MKLRMIPVSSLRKISPAIAVLPKTADSFYQSKEWRSLVVTIIRKRGRICEKCGRSNCRLFADHIIEIKDGGPKLDQRNIQLLCGSCHTLKTNQARAHRMRLRPQPLGGYIKVNDR